VAGIPEARMIVLPLALGAAGLPDQVILAAIPLIMTVDWIIARARSGVNVLSDMLVVILLDVRCRGRPQALSRNNVSRWNCQNSTHSGKMGY
jgi:Na+/H+-dicarboxylate symporter